MKTIRFLLLAGLVFVIIMPGNMLQAQDAKPGDKGDPDVKWRVRKEYDEQGNLIYYDSSRVQSWKHLGFRGPCGGHVFGDLDSLIFHGPMGFQSFREFHDSNWTDSFFPDSLFPDAFTPFGEYFPFDEFPFNPRSFRGLDGFFDGHKEWIDKFQEEFDSPDDSSYHHHPKWQQLPGQQKKRPEGIEI